MLQLAIVLVVLTLVLVYVIRHYVKALREDVTACTGCSGSCCHPPDDGCDRTDPPAANTG
jgi:hypothetical protein